MRRVGVLVHPVRPVHGALETLRRWTAARDLEIVQVQTGDRQPQVAPPGEVGSCDLVAAIGGDGTVLKALHAAAKAQTPVLGVACGSLGILGTVSGAELEGALDRFAAGDWLPRVLPALSVRSADGYASRAINDLVLVRRGATQLVVGVSVGDELYVRSAGDGVVVSTALGSSAYSMAAGGSLLLSGTNAYVCTPIAMHGGCAPPLVVSADREVTLDVDPGHGGFDVELDGQRAPSTSKHFSVTLEDGYATLVDYDGPDGGLTGLRRRGLISDSPRLLARDSRVVRTEVAARSG